MTGFSAEWLALREPADARARDVTLTARLAGWTHRQPTSRFMDLACGTGANLRYLAPHLGSSQHWLMADSDRLLLERIAAFPRCTIETLCLDLATELHALDFSGEVVVTASALLDLVSDPWLVQLVDRCRAGGCAALFALSYDGRVALTPADADDEWIRQLVNRHQLTDKGFGPALGPGAAHRVRQLFAEAAYHVETARSDWHLQPREQLLQQQLLEGWASAALDLAPNDANRCREWLARRLAHVASGASRIIVGHEDVLALPRA